MEEYVCMIIIDSDSRFNDTESDTEPLYKKLPHDKYGWNRFDGIYRNNSIFYKNKKVIDLEEISHCYKGIDIDDNTKYKWYYFYISSTKLKSEEDYQYYTDNKFIDNRTLYFDANPMTNAHIHFKITIE